ncbi:TetR/AcrR family transcriptional regulator C-terminal ligand-binding domain-containing protein [Streptomyces sp. NPDC001941]|uniref:TetR/AcrR family transcriptional regulator n=1 Tax=Streptomyces sp. NPDC001941 TaxID=3154659 RepID=UPI00332852F8
MTAPATGRPRDPAIDLAVRAATLDVLREQGYSGFALERVAALAGTTKAAVRRRWPVRQALVLDALAAVLVVPPAPDNGCTRCDLQQCVRLLDHALHQQLPPGVLAPLVADCAGDPELHRRLLDQLVEPSRRAAAVAVERAVARGDLLPDVPARTLVDVLAATVYQRALLGGGPATEEEVVSTVDLVLRGAAVDFDELVRISRGPAHLRHPHGAQA